jgi:hypothetical protein
MIENFKGFVVLGMLVTGYLIYHSCVWLQINCIPVVKIGVALEMKNQTSRFKNWHRFWDLQNI